MAWTFQSVGTVRGVIKSIRQQAKPSLFPPIDEADNKQKAAVAELIISQIRGYKGNRFAKGVSIFASGHASEGSVSLKIEIASVRVDV